MIVTCQTMKEIEDRAFASGATAEALMEDAGAQIAAAVRQFVPEPGCCLVVFGKGHNGGDALVAARHLAASGWQITLEQIFPVDALAPLTLKKLEAFQEIEALTSESAQPRHEDRRTPVTVILDALLGIGAKPGLREPLSSATARINRRRRETGAAVFAIDLPTGLDGDTGAADPDAVIADFTLAIGFAKRGLVSDAAIDFVGRLAVLSLAALTAPANASTESVATPRTLAGLRPPRRFSTHKGDCGRVGLIAGSRGLTGAAVMAANAAVRAGAGLVSLFVTPDIYSIVASAAMPEVMTAPIDCYLNLLEKPFDGLAIGPGLGQSDADDFLTLIERFPGPMVVDADALNLLATGENLELLRRAAGPRLLTPHPGEMLRLFPESAGLSRIETARRFLESFPDCPITLLLKGARTLVAERALAPKSPTSPAAESDATVRMSFNSTGNPGMATGGMGDVLTGTCAALAGQGLSLFDAARVGAWVCGRAAELAIFHWGHSQESLCATDLLDFFGPAFDELRQPAGA